MGSPNIIRRKPDPRRGQKEPLAADAAAYLEIPLSLLMALVKSFQAVAGKDSSPQSRFLVSRTSTAASLCPTSTHSLPIDFELTRQLNSAAKLDIGLLEEPAAAPCARLAEPAPLRAGILPDPPGM